MGQSKLGATRRSYLGHYVLVLGRCVEHSVENEREF